MVKAARSASWPWAHPACYLAWEGIAVEALAIPLMLLALFAMGVHSTFFGPIKYAILPQHLKKDEVLAGTGLVEAGTYIAILAGTILAGSWPITWRLRHWPSWALPSWAMSPAGRCPPPRRRESPRSSTSIPSPRPRR